MIYLSYILFGVATIIALLWIIAYFLEKVIDNKNKINDSRNVIFFTFTIYFASAILKYIIS